MMFGCEYLVNLHYVCTISELVFDDIRLHDDNQINFKIISSLFLEIYSALLPDISGFQ